MLKLYGTSTGSAATEPLPTVTANGLHLGEVRAFLVKYYGEGSGQNLNDPMHTLTAKDRMGLVTVSGEEYVIADIGMRMLKPHELYAAQGFPPEYQICPVINGKPISQAAQVRMCGNSVSPMVATALVRANLLEAVQGDRKSA